jgi:porphobilinogen synthase
MDFPAQRLRRLRRTESLRGLVRETRLGRDDLIYPLFVGAEKDVDRPLPQIEGARLLSGGPLGEEASRVADLGIPAVLLFGIPRDEDKSREAGAASAPDGPTQEAVRTIRDAAPELVIIADLCLCEFTTDGHCGIARDGRIDNDLTLDVIRKIAVAQADAGADGVAPSGMMDGAVHTIRTALDEAGHQLAFTMPYSAKFASALYGPFKEATNSSPAESRHATHQLDVGNRREALREIETDIEEGADIVIVKPALSSLDIIAGASDAFPIPIAAYNVSGVCGMLHAAAGSSEEALRRLVLEALTCIRRAGADMIITYFAKDVVRWLDDAP